MKKSQRLQDIWFYKRLSINNLIVPIDLETEKNDGGGINSRSLDSDISVACFAGFCLLWLGAWPVPNNPNESGTLTVLFATFFEISSYQLYRWKNKADK